jgi:hypothetical protein
MEKKERVKSTHDVILSMIIIVAKEDVGWKTADGTG